MNYFTIEDIENILFNGIKYELSPAILQLIRQIETEVHPMSTNEYANSHTNTSPVNSSYSNNNSNVYKREHDRDRHAPYEKHNTHSNDKKKSFNKKTVDGSRHAGKNFANKNITNNDWEVLRNFTSTKIAVNEGVDKSINEIRVLLNKISDKNYDTYSEKVVVSVKEFMDSTTDAESISKLSNAIFEIISKNKYFSELYAKLYVKLIVNHTIFVEILNKYIFYFKENISQIKYVDPDKDYDGFCENTKVNDVRKASLTFIMNLFKMDIVDIEKIHEIIYYLLNRTTAFIDEPDKTHDVEEITENVFIIVSMGMHKLMGDDIWKNSIFPIITKISAMKAKDHVSLTNRTVFKYMDIIDSIE
jgi:hypothetical protein